MRYAGVMALLVLGAASVGAGPAANPDADGAPAACLAACEEALGRCEAAAAAEVKRCRAAAFAPCDDWCPCTQFIGAAYFACLLECDRCTAAAEEDAAECDDGASARAACRTARRHCAARCAEPAP